MDRKTLLAMMLCFGVVAIWQGLNPSSRVLPQSNPSSEELAGAQPQAKATLEADQLHIQHSAPSGKEVSQPIQVNLKESQFTVGTGAAFFQNWVLKNYTLSQETREPVSLDKLTNESGAVLFAVNEPDYKYLEGTLQGKIEKLNSGAVRWSYSDDLVSLERVYQSDPEGRYVDLTLKAKFKGKAPSYAFVSLKARGLEEDSQSMDRKIIYYDGSSTHPTLLSEEMNEELVHEDSNGNTLQWLSINENLKWIAVQNRYFMLSVLPRGSFAAKGLAQPYGSSQGGKKQGARLSLSYQVSGNEIELPLRVYFGPTDLKVMQKVDESLSASVDFGWFSFLAFPILKFMNWLYGYVQNYGLAIILMTLLLKLVTYPLNYKSMKSMKKMATLQPKIQKLRERYGDDKEALNREMMNMMRTQGYNPMAGCLPILIQMPVFFALYRVLYSSVELYQAPFFLWIHDLSMKDPYFVTPILLTLVMFLQQKITPNTATDETQKRIMQFMPVMFGALMVTLPAGLTLYMLINAASGILQQWFMNKKFDNANLSTVPARAR